MTKIDHIPAVVKLFEQQLLLIYFYAMVAGIMTLTDYPQLPAG